MKTLHVLTFAALALVVCACKNGKDEKESQKAESEVKQETADTQQEEAIEEQSADRAMFGLQGEVKELSSKLYESNEQQEIVDERIENEHLYFDANGNLTQRLDCVFEEGDLRRDASGRIVGMEWHSVYGDGVEYGSSTEFEYKDALVSKSVKYESGELSICTTTEYVYENGELVAEKETSVNEGNIFKTDREFTILNRDEKGNWTRRFTKAVNTEQLLDEDLNLMDPETSVEYFIEERTIKY